MTTADDLHDLTLRTPDGLLAALPYLLGFPPAHSAVVVWLHDGRIVLTQRLDLPTDDESARSAWSAAVWDHAAVARADELVLVIVDERADPRLVELVSDRAAREGIVVKDVLHLHEDRWWSLLCTDPQCCPEQGRSVDPAAKDAVGAEFALLGRAPLPSREALEQSYAPDAAAQAAVVEAGVPPLPRGRERERWRDERITDLLALLGSEDARTAEASSVAVALAGLADIRVRDTLLWEAASWPLEPLEHAVDAIAALVRAAPTGRVAPVATCAAVLAWLAGDGARARVALDRAHEDDPAYSLAGLVHATVTAGLPPDAWREAMAGLTRADCRHGFAT